MSLSIILALLAFVILAAVNILDKFVMQKRLAPATFVFFSSIFLLPVVLLLPFGVRPLSGATDWAWAVFSGFTFCLSLWTMYVGLQKNEASHFTPFTGAAVAFFVLCLSSIFLRERLSIFDVLAIFVLIGGSLLIASGCGVHGGWDKKFIFWGLLAGFFSAVSQVAAKHLYDSYGFYSGMVWRVLAIAVFGIFLLFSAVVRREAFGGRGHAAKGHLSAVVWNKILGVAGIVLFQYAVALGSVTIVNALAGVQYALLIILIAVLSRFYPGLFRESYTRGEMRREIISVIIIAAGLAFFVW